MIKMLVRDAPFSEITFMVVSMLALFLVLILYYPLFYYAREKESKVASVAAKCLLGAYLIAFVGSAAALMLLSSSPRPAAEGDYTPYGVYEATVERVTLTDYTVRTDYGAVLTLPYSMGWVDGHVDKGDRVALDVSRMSLNENQSIIMRGGDDMSVMFMRDEACVSRFDSRGARVPNGVECHRAFGDTEYKGSVLLGGGGTYYVLTGVSRL